MYELQESSITCAISAILAFIPLPFPFPPLTASIALLTIDFFRCLADRRSLVYFQVLSSSLARGHTSLILIGAAQAAPRCRIGVPEKRVLIICTQTKQ